MSRHAKEAQPAPKPAAPPENASPAVYPHSAALAWRKERGLSRAALARWIGFSPSQIQDYEQGARRGKQGADAAISDAALLRYGLACAALSAGLKTPF